MAILTAEEKEARYKQWEATREYNEYLDSLTPAERLRTFCSGMSKICVAKKHKPRGAPWDWDLTDEQKQFAHPYLSKLLKKWSAYGPIPRWRYAALIAHTKSVAKSNGKYKFKPGDRTWELRYSILDKQVATKVKIASVKSKRQLKIGSPTPTIFSTMPDGGRLEGI